MAEHERSPCYALLERRREQLGGMLEHARRLEDYRLIRFLDAHTTVLWRLMESL